LILMM